MALKLGKCRLCLKLGDFYSIFTVDDAVQLADMVMECTRVKVYNGDGLPDKVCSECIQKLSSAYIFKQQCERADQELRRNYVPPPGFSMSPLTPNRQSSDSAFSNHTDISNQTKPSSSESAEPAAGRSRKRSRESADNTSLSSRSHEFAPTKRVSELRSPQKKRRVKLAHNSFESDYEDNSISHFSAETDSDEPLVRAEHRCGDCGKVFRSNTGLCNHVRAHRKRDALALNQVVDIPAGGNDESPLRDAVDDDDKLNCGKCGKTFKLKIMLKRHLDSCGKTPVISPQKQLLVALQPIDAMLPKKFDCEICSSKFKSVDNLEKHMRVVHAAVLKRDPAAPEVGGRGGVPCLYCRKGFDEYSAYNGHLNSCPEKYDMATYQCLMCPKVSSNRSAYCLHVKNIHFERRNSAAKQTLEAPLDTFECRMCSKRLASQELLITHLAAHMSSMDEGEPADDDSKSSLGGGDTGSVSDYGSPAVPTGQLQCRTCHKRFKYKKALQTHEQRHLDSGAHVKAEPPDKPAPGLPPGQRPDDSDSSQEEADDNTCDICEKQFSYKRLLVVHKRNKHNQCSGTKRAKINLKDCSVRCLICDLDMKVSAINAHNQTHMADNIKPRNLYSCAECCEKVNSCSALANHIKFVHRLKQKPAPKKTEALECDGELADFCEVVVTKSEPLDAIQSHNDFGEVPGAAAVVDLNGFTCPICNKNMPTLISLKRHVNWHSNVGNNLTKKIECFVCKETFRFQCHYKLHMRAHYRDPTLDARHLTCATCGRRSKHLRAALAHLNFHKQTRFNTKDYQCAICERVFQYRKVYLSHMAIHFKRGESAHDAVVAGGQPPSGPAPAPAPAPPADPSAPAAAAPAPAACPLCGKVCDSETSLKHHVRWHRSKSSLYGARHPCALCGLRFTNKRRLLLHTRAHYEDDAGPYKCPTCGKGYTDEEYFRRHVKGHNFDSQAHKDRIERLRKDKVKCPICQRYYPDLGRLIRHLRRTHPESAMVKEDPDAPPPARHSCKLCAKTFLDERQFRRHERAHLRKPLFYQCKFCGKNTISLKSHNVHIKSHLCKKYRERPLQCPRCADTFVKGYALHHHLRDAHGVAESWARRPARAPAGPLRALQCGVCRKVLASQRNYERHLDYHNGLRCNYCFQHFSSPRFLEGHLAFGCDKRRLIGDTETFPKKLKCPFCYKPFHLQVKLDCHLRIRHDVRSFREVSADVRETVCDYCFRVFENEDALAGHKVYHRSVGFYGCLYCKRKFNTVTLFNKHKNHHLSQSNAANPTACEHCDETFVAFRDMIHHMRDVHGDDKDWIVMPKDSVEETCAICDKKFYNLHKHLAYHEENRCKKCGEYFFSRADYDDHLCAIESDDEELQLNGSSCLPAYEECRFCFKPVTKSNSKKLHDNIHRTSGSISCRFCSLKFKTMDAFNIHAFSHRSRKYNKKPIKCRKCGEKFVKYGPFMKHMKHVHKSTKKVHYRTEVRPERCVVCGDDFPNLHNHYRAHLLNQCQLCRKYFTSARLFAQHQCDKEDSDPSKVFECDEDLTALIKSYVPKGIKDDEKFYGRSDEDEEEAEPEPEPDKPSEMAPDAAVPVRDDSSQAEEISQDEKYLHLMDSSPIISDVLSLYQHKDKKDAKQTVDNVVTLTDDESLDIDNNVPVITID